MPGGDAGLPAHADGRLLSEPGNHPELPRGDRAPLLGPAPQGPHPALPDEGRPRREGQRGPQLSAGSKEPFITSLTLCSVGNSTDFYQRCAL